MVVKYSTFIVDKKIKATLPSFIRIALEFTREVLFLCNQNEFKITQRDGKK